MNAQTMPDQQFSTRTKSEAEPEHAEAAFTQEQFTGPVPVRSERPMSEILNERQAESDADGASPAFIP